MKLWKISQTENSGLDTYDAAIVVAETEELARTLHPSNMAVHREQGDESWATSPDNVKCEYLGEARTLLGDGVILASFNAG